MVNLAVDVASGATNIIPWVGPWFSAAVSGIYTGYSTYQSGATLEGAIISGVIAGSLTAFSIGNLAEFDKSVFQIITNGVTYLVFGSGYAMISAAISKWQAIQGRSSPRRADTLKPTEN